jgi:hypothetical protein
LKLQLDDEVTHFDVFCGCAPPVIGLAEFAILRVLHLYEIDRSTSEMNADANASEWDNN